MPFGTSKECVCKECSMNFPHLKKLSEHIKKIHSLSSIDYYVKHEHNNVRPACLACNGETRFVSLGDGFKKYCATDRKIAESEAGKIGGKIKKTWNKDKTRETDVRIASLAAKQTGSGNAFYGHHHSDESLEKMAVTKRLSYEELQTRAVSAGAALLSDHKMYVDQNSLLHVECVVCRQSDNVSLLNIDRCWRCRTCFPIGSKQQLEIVEFIRSLGFIDVEVSTRKIIPPLELDIWIPSRQLAIEYHGLYWHSGGKDGLIDKRSHRKKYEACVNANIRLMQFFSDEWINKGDICRSMIKNALGLAQVKLHARDCKVEILSPVQSKAFVDDNHISGSTHARHHLGLVHKKLGLVGVSTTRTPIQKRYGNVCELARMCFLKGTSVRGGASKLLSYVRKFAAADGFEGLLSYAELRYGEGSVYEKCGLTLVGETMNNYWYCDEQRRYDRFKFRAQPGKPEKQVAEEAGVRAIWGSGNKVYLMKL